MTVTGLVWSWSTWWKQFNTLTCSFNAREKEKKKDVHGKGVKRAALRLITYGSGCIGDIVCMRIRGGPSPPRVL